MHESLAAFNNNDDTNNNNNDNNNNNNQQHFVLKSWNVVNVNLFTILSLSKQYN